MYLARALPLLFPIFAPNWLRSEDSALNLIIFAFLRNPLKFAALVALTMGMTIHKRGINYYLFEFIIKK